VRVGYELGEIESSLLDHPIMSDVLEAVFGLHVVKTVVNGWWCCGVRGGLDGLSPVRSGFGFHGGLWDGRLGFPFVSSVHHFKG